MSPGGLRIQSVTKPTAQSRKQLPNSLLGGARYGIFYMTPFVKAEEETRLYIPTFSPGKFHMKHH